MIDFSLIVVSKACCFFPEKAEWRWRVRQAGRRLVRQPTPCGVHDSGAGAERKDPALTRIDYHASTYRFLRKNGGCGRMAIVFVVRVAGSLLDVLSQARLALPGERRRGRRVAHRGFALGNPWGGPVSLRLTREEARR